MNAQEQRKATRISKPIEIEYSAESPTINARILDMSEKGLFVETHHPLTVDSLLSCRFYLADETPEQPIVGIGRVRWVQPWVGVGIEFIELNPQHRERIRFFVASVFFGHQIVD
jgi:hypothetical protein